MKTVVSVGNQTFETIREESVFYVDKTSFIKEWWEAKDVVTLITRPRRFGKTLNMSMVECFFSNKYEDRGDLFEGLSIWEDEKYRKLQGTYPVIFLSFADMKQQNYEDAVKKVKNILTKLYNEYTFILDWEGLTKNEKEQFLSVRPSMDDVTAQDAIKNLCDYLSRYYQKKVIVLLDEYDTPMQEAYLGGYSREGNEPCDCLQVFGDCPRAHGWNNHERDEFTQFIRSMFNSTFKTNPYLERAIMTGITRVSKESIFSDLNNPRVITTTSDEYATYFGFTEQEVYAALEQFNLGDRKQDVKAWYDGLTFGKYTDIYNPWSITYFLKEKKLASYWANSSSNGLVDSLIRTGNSTVKKKMESLLQGNTITVELDEQVIFDQLQKKKNAIWSFLLASGYLKVVYTTFGEASGKREYELALTNKEVTLMFQAMISEWFDTEEDDYNGFIKALLKGNLKEMNVYMNEVALATFSTFDTGKQPSVRSQSERFYHGFVLGLLVELRGDYEVISNSESGLGRYDIMICPLKPNLTAFVLEFKVIDDTEEKSLEDTVKAAHKQIEEMKYDTRLLERGIKKEQIRHYGFAFEGKKVLIG